MKKTLKKAVVMVLLVCLVMPAFCVNPAQAQAAGFKKSFSKTMTLKDGNQGVISFDAKDKGAITIVVTSKSKLSKHNVQINVPAAQFSGGTYFINMEKSKGTLTVDLDEKGSASVYISNFSAGTEKLKVKIKGKKTKVKFLNMEVYDEVG